jgi:Fe-S cluster assembly iron-binding protein IscA
MVEVTERAAGALESMLSKSDASQETGVRIVEEANSFGMRIDNVREGDEVVWRHERPVLIADGQVAETLSGHTIDFQTAADGREHFRLT